MYCILGIWVDHPCSKVFLPILGKGEKSFERGFSCPLCAAWEGLESERGAATVIFPAVQPHTALHKGFSGFSSHPSYMLYVHIYSLSGGFRIFTLGLEFIGDLPEERIVKFKSFMFMFPYCRECSYTTRWVVSR